MERCGEGGPVYDVWVYVGQSAGRFVRWLSNGWQYLVLFCPLFYNLSLSIFETDMKANCTLCVHIVKQ